MPGAVRPGQRREPGVRRPRDLVPLGQHAVARAVDLRLHRDDGEGRPLRGAALRAHRVRLQLLRLGRASKGDGAVHSHGGGRHRSRSHRAPVARRHRPAGAAACAALAAGGHRPVRDFTDAPSDRRAAVAVARRRSRASPRRRRASARRAREPEGLFAAARVGSAAERPSRCRQRNGRAAGGFCGCGHGRPRRCRCRAALSHGRRRAQCR